MIEHHVMAAATQPPVKPGKVLYGRNMVPPRPAEPAKPNRLQEFVAAHIRFNPIAMSMTFKSLYERFQAWLPINERHEWSRIRVSRALPDPFTTRTGNENVTFVLRAEWIDAGR